MTILCDRCGAEYDEALKWIKSCGQDSPCEIDYGNPESTCHLCPVCTTALRRWVVNGPRKYKVVEVSECL